MFLSLSDMKLEILLGLKREKNEKQFQSRQWLAFVMPLLIRHFCARILKKVSFKNTPFPGQGGVEMG